MTLRMDAAGLHLGVACATLLSGCYEGTPPDRAPVVDADFEIPATGVSETIDFEVPEDVRSLTVTVKGDPSSLLALESLVLSDGFDRITLGAAATVPQRLAEIYASAALVETGQVRQFVRLGTFSLLYPETYQQELPAGPATLRVASSAAGGVHVSVVAPPEDDADVLHVNVIAVSDTPDLASPPRWLGQAQSIFDQAGIRLVVDATRAMPPAGFVPIAPGSVPTPDDTAAHLARAGHDLVASDGVNLFVADPFEAIGFSLAMPGPLDPSSYYWGVVVSSAVPWSGDPDLVLGRVVAHELSHFLGVQHTEDFLASGDVVPDPFDDTETFGRNLMGSVDQAAPLGPEDLVISPRQAFRLRRSALLATE